MRFLLLLAGVIGLIVVTQSANLSKSNAGLTTPIEHPDSVGMSFAFVFPWNNGDQNNPPKMWIDLYAYDYHEIDVEIEYNQIIYDKQTGASTTKLCNKTITFSDIDQFFFNQTTSFLTDNVDNKYPDSRIFVTSNENIGITAHNYMPDGTGDSFTVLPTSMAGKDYSVLLPPVDVKGARTVYIMPVGEDDAEIQITYGDKAEITHYNITAKYPSFLWAINYKPIETMYLSSNTPIVLVAAVQHLPETSGSSQTDFGVFMPIPVYSSDCMRTDDVYDSHITMLYAAQYYLYASTNPKCCKNELTISGINVNDTLSTSCDEKSYLHQMNPLTFGPIAGVQSKGSMLEMLQYGEYKNFNNASLNSGAYLNLVPSWSQFITGIATFSVPFQSNEVTIIANAESAGEVFLDYSEIPFWAPVPFFDGNALYATATLEKGFHTIKSYGKYLVFVTGSTNGSAYGFTPFFNVQKMEPQFVLPTEAPTAGTLKDLPLSFGTKFVTLFPWNNGNKTEPPTISLDLTNPNNEEVNVTISYSNILINGSVVQETVNITIPPNASHQHFFDSSAMFYNTRESTIYNDQYIYFNNPSDSRIIIESTASIAVIAHNYMPSGSGDTFTVFPVSMIGKKYSIKLPASSPDGIAIVYFIPVANVEAYVEAWVYFNETISDGNFMLEPEFGKTIVSFQMKKEFTIYAKSDEIFGVIAAVQKLPTSSTNSKSMDDFGCFMAVPYAENDCTDCEDLHLAALDSGTNFFLTEMWYPLTDLSVLVKGSNGINNTVTTTLHTMGTFDFDSKLYGNTFDTHSKSLINMLKYGDIEISSGRNGAFLNLIPSWSQFVTGQFALLVLENSSVITIFGDSISSISTLLNGKVDMLNWTLLPHLDQIAYSTKFKLDAGVYTVVTSGQILVKISGIRADAAYEYFPVLNVPRLTESPVVVIVPTTPKPMAKIDAASISTNFVFVFPPNDDKATEADLNIYLSLVNSNNQAATIDITYQVMPNSSIGQGQPVTRTVSLAASSAMELMFNDSVVSHCKSMNGFVQCANTRVQIVSDLAISVLANSYWKNTSGDSFTVMPTSMAGNRYALSLDGTGALDAYSTVYFLPLENDVEIDVTVNGKTSYNKQITVNMNDQHLTALRAQTAFSLYAVSNQKFVVIGAVQKLVSYPNQKLDFGAYMPTPVLSKDCLNGVIDEHVSTLLETGHFFMTMPTNSCAINVNIYGDSGLNSVQKSYMTLLGDEYGNNAGFKSSNGALQLTSSGAFIDMDVSISQFVTDIVGFVLPSSSNIITIIGDKTAPENTLLDNEILYPYQWIPISYLGNEYFYTTGSLSSGYHKVDSTGHYTISINGEFNAATYGFVPAYNNQLMNTTLPPMPPAIAPNVPVAESIGTEFVLVFAPMTNLSQMIGIDLINLNLKPTLVEIFSRENMTTKIASIFVPAFNSTWHWLDSNYISVCSKEVFGECTNSALFIKSTEPISVVAHNYLMNSGDSFTVLPTSMAGNMYALTVPEAAYDGVGRVFLLPVGESARVQVSIMRGRVLKQKTFDLNANASSIAAVSGANGFTLYATGNADFSVFVAVQSLRASSDPESTRTDFGAYMPTAVTNNVCQMDVVIDEHFLMLSTTSSLYVTLPTYNCGGFNVETFGKYISNEQLLSGWNKINVEKYKQNNNNFAMISQNAALQVLRYGSNHISDSLHTDGAYLDLDVSQTQMVTGITAFSVPSVINEINIIGDIESMRTALFDGSYPIIWDQISYSGSVTYYASTSVTTGFHYITSQGFYSIFVSGIRQNASYGFVPTLNSQKIMFQPPKPSTTTKKPASSTESPKNSSSTQSIGTEFIFVIPQMANPKSTPQTASVVLINPNSQWAYIVIEYNEAMLQSNGTWTIANRLAYIELTKAEMLEFVFNENVINHCNEWSMGSCLNTQIRVYSSVGISLLVNNYVDGESGDSFTVMPTSMAGKVYAVSAPAISPHNSIIEAYFLPVSDDAFQILVEIFDGTKKIEKTIKFESSALVFAYRSQQGFTMYATGTASFAMIIVAQINNSESIANEFAAYMPTPIPDQYLDCGPSQVIDYHIVKGVDNSILLFTPPSSQCNFTVKTYADNGIENDVMVGPNGAQIALFYKTTGIHSSDGMLQALRCANTNKSGSYLDLDVSWSQYVTGSTLFYVPFDMAVITLTGDVDAMALTVLDNYKIIFDWMQLPYFEGRFFYASMLVTKGLHALQSTGRYTIFVSGINNNAQYGFTVAYNEQWSKPLPALPRSTTAGPTTTTIPTTTSPPPKVSSVGTDFVFVIPTVSSNTQLTQTVDLIITNPFLQADYAYLEYNYAVQIGDKWNITTRTDKLNLTNVDSYEYTFNAHVINYCNGTDLVDCPNTRVRVRSAVGISLLLINYVNNKFGDSFTVLPKTMAGTNYATAMPKPNADGATTAYFMSTNGTAVIDIKVFTDNSGTHNTFQATIDDSKISAFRSTKAFTLYATSDKPFVMIMSEQSLPRSDPSLSDYGAFMPTPLLDTSCGSQQIYDFHMAMLLDSEAMMLVGPSSTCNFTAEAFGLDGKEYDVIVKPFSELTTFANKQFGSNVGICSKNGMLQAIRYGGFGDGYPFGSYLDLDVSWSQFVTGTTYFYVPSDSNIVTIIGDEDAVYDTVYDTFEDIFTWVPLPYFGGRFYYATCSATKGLHSFGSNGLYSIFVRGEKNAAGYGFVASYNDQNSMPLPPTPVPTSTSTANPSTSSSSTSSSSLSSSSSSLSSSTSTSSTSTSSSPPPRPSGHSTSTTPTTTTSKLATTNTLSILLISALLSLLFAKNNL